jgi:3-oxoacyl-[acyl-carrier protein] reductase
MSTAPPGGAPLAGKVAIVTGGSRGIGNAIAGLLADHGAAVVVSGRDADRLRSAVKELEQRGGAVLGVAADAAKREDADRLVEAARERFGRIDVLVNNAGITRDGLLVRMKDDDWDRVMEVNLRGAFLMTRAVAKAMVRQKTGGRIINIASTAGAMGNAGQVNYSAAKAGLIGLTKACARELAHWSILVNAVAPGLIDTGFDPLPETVKAAHAASLPLGRLGAPADVVGAYVFLASDESRTITGQSIVCDAGGYMLG